MKLIKAIKIVTDNNVEPDTKFTTVEDVMLYIWRNSQQLFNCDTDDIGKELTELMIEYNKLREKVGNIKQDILLNDAKKLLGIEEDDGRKEYLFNISVRLTKEEFADFKKAILPFKMKKCLIKEVN